MAIRRWSSACSSARPFHGQRSYALTPLVQERDRIGARFSKEFHRQGGLLGAVGHGLEPIGEIEQHLIVGAKGCVLILKRHADGSKTMVGLLGARNCL